jgi:hypothetical protein
METTNATPDRNVATSGAKDGHGHKLTIVVGAGASYDCADSKTAAEINDQYRPPLAKDIFETKFNKILSRYPAVTARLDELRTKLARDGNFEKTFRTLLDSAALHQTYWPFQVPLYLRELFWAVSLDYLQGSSKFDTLVRGVLESSFERILFINVNYDLLLEDALANYNGHELDSLGAYVSNSNRWMYVKPHGSVNWARILENCPKDSSGWHLPSRLQEPPRFSAELELVRWNRHSHDFYRPGGGPPGYRYPQIVVPTDAPKTFVCPQPHVDLAKQFIQGCGDFLLVGFSGRDDDIVSLLKMMPRRSRLKIVSRGDTRQIFGRMCSREPSLKNKELALTFHSAGFSKFVGSKAFESWLTGRRVSGKTV